ncbi:hypothetical protein BJX70DRAFT_392203 [Aspergillus crustosus]
MNQASELEFSPNMLPKSVKVRSTCNACQQAKIRCSHDRPSCTRCRRNNITCVYSISRRLGRPAKRRDPHLDSSPIGQGSGCQTSKKIRGTKKKKLKGEPISDSGIRDQSVVTEDNSFFDTFTFDSSHIDGISMGDSSLQTPKYTGIITAAPFSDPFDIDSDVWLQDVMSSHFPDSTLEPGFPDPFDTDMKIDDASTKSMNLESLPAQPESFSDSTSEGLDIPSSSNYFAAINECPSQNDSTSNTAQVNPVYPEQLKQEGFAWSQPISSLAGDFTTDPSSLFGRVSTSKRSHDFGFAEDDFKASVTSLSSIVSCQNHEQVVRDLIRASICALRPGPTIGIDSILTCQRVLQKLTETVLQCRVCSQIRVDLLMMVIVSIDSLLNALDAITSAESDVVERLFPDYLSPLTQEYRADSALSSHARRFKGGSLHLRTQLDTCPLIIGGFCVPSEEKFSFVKRVLQNRLSGLLRTVHRIQLCTQESLAASESRARLMMMQEMNQKLRWTMPLYPDRSAAEIDSTDLSTEVSDSTLYQLIIAAMESDVGCQCSIGALQIMNELRSVHTVVELETILDLVERIQSHGQSMLKCKECRANPSSSLMTLPALTEQSLSLFEAACLAYNVTRTSTLFDPSILGFEHSLPQFLCIRSKVQLGQMELDDDEMGVLVRMLLGKNSMKLLELLEGLRSLSKDSGKSHKIGVPALRSESSVESAIRRILVFIEQLELDSERREGESTRAFKMADPLTPADNFANHRVFDLTLGDSVRMVKKERLVESDDVWNETPAGKCETAFAVGIFLNVIGVELGDGGWNAEEHAVVIDPEW